MRLLKELWNRFYDYLVKRPGVNDGGPNKTMKKLPEQITRLAVVFGVFITLIVVVRVFILPAELKETGINRKSAIERELAKPVRYAGAHACSECHEDEYETKKAGYHANLACETCHGALQAHTEDPEEESPFLPQTREFCPVCHTYNLSRPTGYPQINPIAHNPLKPCSQCHNPHDPVPPEVPQTCSACHAQIVRTKAVSHHVGLECTVCHNVPEEHRINPRSVKPSKPANRTFCAQCHGFGSKVIGTPKIDIETHGEKYLCWQCHYPHLPEVK
jgi:hypothetical protein